MNTKISEKQWISWLVATATAAIVLVSFVYTTFATKSEASEARNDLEKRLDRLEQKIDIVIFKIRN